MSDATDAIVDIEAALVEYGSAITLRKVTSGGYDPYTGATLTKVDTSMKCFISNMASHQISQQFSKDTYDLAVKVYFNGEISKVDKFVYEGQVFNIVYISSKILQDTTLIYEILIVR